MILLLELQLSPDFHLYMTMLVHCILLAQMVSASPKVEGFRVDSTIKPEAPYKATLDGIDHGCGFSPGMLRFNEL